MPTTLEIRYYTGETETRQLSKTHPLSIGRHSSNDLCIDDDAVAVMHCRISWNRRNYELSAANLDGVDVNGTLVRHAPLRDGDVLRIGPVDIHVHSDQEETADQTAPQEASPDDGPKSSQVELKPISESEVFAFQEPLPPAESPPPERKDSAGSKPKPKQASAKKDESPPSASGKPEENDATTTLPEDLYEELMDEGDEGEDEHVGDRPVLHRSTRFAGDVAVETRPAEATETVSLGERLKTLKTQLRPRPVRPGEQDTARSPLVLSLGGGTLALVLAALTIYFIIGRQKVERHYEAAVSELKQGHYDQAIQLFEEFLKEHPLHKYADSVYIDLGKARVEAAISGSTPDWNRGLSELQTFIKEYRDRPNFQEQRETIRQYAERIALGAAKRAEVAAQSDLLDVSQAARKILDAFSPTENPPVELQKTIEQQLRTAKDAIEKHNTFDAAVADIERAIQGKKVMDALKARLDLVNRYRDFEHDSRIVALLDKTLQTERSLVQGEDVNRNAVQQDRSSAVPKSLSLTLHVRARTDENSDGRTVLAVAKDCCYGIDMITGAPVWRRVIGLDTPFFPVSVSTSVPGVLLFDTNHQELQLVESRTGNLVWRQPLGEDVAGPPLVHQGQIYLPTSNHHLDKIDLASGRMTTRLGFSQKLLAPPVLIADEQHLVLAGDEALLYTVSLRPLECVAVSYLGHQAGSIQAPLLKMGALVLLAENDRMDSSQLRALDTRSQDHRLKEVGSERLDGSVRDAPVLRGKQLFVPYRPERVAAFTVSDEPGKQALTVAARYPVPTAQPGPLHLFLEAGPDGQLWMSGSALRRLHLKTETLNPDPNEIASGISTQPLQMVRRYLFVGRRLPYSQAVVFTQVDRERMESQWKAVLGSSVLGWTSASGNSIVCVTEQGDLFRVSPPQVEAGGFQTRPAAQLSLPESLNAPLRTAMLSDGRLAVAAGGESPRLWIVNQVGQIERQVELDGPLEADPAQFATGIVLPLPGKLRLIGPRSVDSRTEDYLAPIQKDQQPHWIHVAALDEAHLIALDDQGRLAKIQRQTAPVPNLTAVGTIQLERLVDVPFLVDDGKLMLADSAGRLQMLDGATFEPLSEVALESPASQAPWAVGDRLYVEVGGKQLNCFEIKDKLKRLWNLSLDGVGVAGPPLLSKGALVVALQNGSLLNVNPDTGEVRRRLDAAQPLSLGPLQVGSMLVVPAVDGSVYHVESVLQASPQEPPASP